MNIQQLLEERRIYKGTIARATIVAALNRAQRDLDTARAVIKIDTDWAFSIAYNAVLQASRAFMFLRDSARRATRGTRIRSCSCWLWR